MLHRFNFKLKIFINYEKPFGLERSNSMKQQIV